MAYRSISWPDTFVFFRPAPGLAPFLSISHLKMNLCVTRLAQGHQVIRAMRPAFRHWHNMMDFLHRYCLTMFKTHLT